MRKLVLGCLAGALLAPAWADDDDRLWRRDRDRRVYEDDDDYYRQRGPFGARRGSIYSRTALPVDRAIRDLQSAASSRYMRGHNRDHVEKALDELYKFQDRWAQGRWDEGKLDKAIDNMKHLAQADEINPRDRNRIARDIEDLRAFRAGRGGYGYRNEPVYGRWPRY